jgi:beta-glucosidase
MQKLVLAIFISLGLALCTACTPRLATATRAPMPTAAPASSTSETPAYRNTDLPVEKRVEDLLSRMTLQEKIGQMTQVASTYIKPDDITTRLIGSILSGGDGAPNPNSLEAWAKMVNGYQAYALKTRLGIPLIYGVDAVHGLGGLRGATVFPHNVGLGATRDADLVQRIGRATAEEMVAAGITWNFGPVIAVPQDIRWGRTYEGYSENTQLVSQLGAAYIRGLQNADDKTGLHNPLAVLATAKHFIGDGGTKWGTSRTDDYKLDQGDLQVDEATLRALYLPPYKAAIDAGAQSIMVSFSSWNGVKMHAQKHLLTDVLKSELGFQGFVVSDWAGIDQISRNYDDAIVTSINAGLDMIMVPDKYPAFIDGLTRAVNSGRVPTSRIDDAVRRILTVKMELGLFERPMSDPATLFNVGSDAHRQLAREAVRKSLVLLKNENKALPIPKDTPLIFVAGEADNVGMQCGGWTLAWQGKSGNAVPGTTILAGIQQTVSPKTHVEYNRDGKFDGVAEVGMVVVGEQPYSEGVGDRADLSLSDADSALIDRVKEHSKKLIVILVSGRPMVVTHPLFKMDAFVAAWLPGAEGQGVADVLFGDYDFVGKLPYTWPRWNSQLPFDLSALPTKDCAAPLFPFGFGLAIHDLSPQQLNCPKP